MEAKTKTEVVVIGAGLAGLAASLELVRMGLNVNLFEASNRLGGKAGSDAAPLVLDHKYKAVKTPNLPADFSSDHGYHVFPTWYRNMYRMWKEIGINQKRDVFNGGNYLALPPAARATRQDFQQTQDADPRQLLAVCELILQPDESVDDLTLQGFLRSRDFDRAAHPIALEEFILNALTIGEASISSRCVRDVFRQWLPDFYPPQWPALKGSLQHVLIDRWHARIRAVARANGVKFTVQLNQPLAKLSAKSRGGPILEITTAPGETTTISGHPVVVAIPLDRLRGCLDPGAFEAIPEVPVLNNLRANAFAALDIHFNTKLANFTPEHFLLHASPYHLSGFDISQHWPELANKNTVLQFVAARSKDLVGLDNGNFVRALAKEIKKYIPEVGTADVAFYVPHRNIDGPLFVNEVGTWKYRPTSKSKCKGLYFAGDFTQNPTDVASMEGAVRTGLLAAEAVREDYAAQADAVIIDPPAAPGPAIQAMYELYRTDPVLARLNCFVLVLEELGKRRAGLPTPPPVQGPRLSEPKARTKR